MVTTERMSRTPDERLYSSGTNDSFGFTQCYVSFGDPDGEDFAFTKCNADGTLHALGLPDGDWRVTVFDQWNDMLVDGLSTPVRLSGRHTTPNMGEIAMNQWQANIYTTHLLRRRTATAFATTSEPGLTLVPTNIRFRDGSYLQLQQHRPRAATPASTKCSRCSAGTWSRPTRPATRTPVPTWSTTPAARPTAPCGCRLRPRHPAELHHRRTWPTRTKQVPLPAHLRVPGAVYCATADCPTRRSRGFTTAGSRLHRPRRSALGQSEGWQGFSGQNSFLEFGKKPFAAGENGGIHGECLRLDASLRRSGAAPPTQLGTAWSRT